MIRYLIKDKKRLIPFLILLVVGSCLGTCFGLVVSALTDCVTQGGRQLLATFLGAVLFVVCYILSSVGYNFLKTKMIAQARRDLKRDLFCSIYFQRMETFEQVGSTGYINELSNNVNLLENLYFCNLIQGAQMLISFLTAAVITVTAEPVMLPVMILIAFFTLWVTKVTAKPLEESTKKYAEAMEEYTSEIKDDFTGFWIVHLFSTIAAVIEKHDIRNDAVEEAKRKQQNRQIICAYTGEAVGVLSTIVIMAVAVYFAQKGSFSIGMVIAFGHLIGHIVSPITSLPTVIANFHAARPIKSKFREILQSEGGSGDGEAAGVKGAISLRQIEFGYEDKQVLRGCSFVFEEGKHYVLLGESGVGKSSLLKLLAGLYENYSGEISVGGKNLKTLSRGEIARTVSMVTQDTFLFNDSIKNNITLFDGAYSDEQIQRVIKMVGLENKIAELPEGINTLLMENGGNVSGGERQRIGLARAMLRDSQIYLLDEFNSNLDEATADELEDSILRIEGRTVITVTHRSQPYKLKKYDHVLRLKDGQLEERNDY